MGALFDSGTDVLSIASNSAIDLPDGPWCWAGMVKLTSNAGSVNHSVVNITGGTGFLSFRIVQSSGTPADDIWGEVNDGTDDVYFESNNTNPFASNTNWTHLALQRTGTGSTCTMEMYVNGTYQAVNSGTGGYTNNAIDSTLSGTLYIGNNSANSRPLSGSMAEFAFWKTSFTAAEIASLSNGFAPIFYRHRSMSVYLPLVRDFVDVKSGLTVSNTGVTVTTHPRIIYPQYTIIGTRAASSTQTLTPALFTNTSTIYGPSVVSIIAPPLFTNTQTFFSHTIVGLGNTLTPPLVDSSVQIFAPTLVPGQVTISPALVGSTETVYAPSVTLSYALVPPLINSTEIIFEPAIIGQYSLAAPLYSNTNTIYNPTVVGQYQLLPSLVMSGVTIYAPALVYAQTVQPPLVASGLTIYSPSVFFEGFSRIAPETSTFTEVTPETADFTLSPGETEDFDLID